MSKKLIPLVEKKIHYWDGTKDSSWRSSWSNEMHISTPEQFIDFLSVNYTIPADTTIYLDNDIYFNEDTSEWMDLNYSKLPNKYWDVDRNRSGIQNSYTFDGNHHTIDGLCYRCYSNGSTYSSCDLFYITSNNKTLTFKNVKFKHLACIPSASNKGYAGFFTSEISGGTGGFSLKNVIFEDIVYQIKISGENEERRGFPIFFRWATNTSYNVTNKLDGVHINNIKFIDAKNGTSIFASAYSGYSGYLLESYMTCINSPQSNTNVHLGDTCHWKEGSKVICYGNTNVQQVTSFGMSYENKTNEEEVFDSWNLLAESQNLDKLRYDDNGVTFYDYQEEDEEYTPIIDETTPIHYQSRTEVEDPTPKYWDGTYDTSWKTKDSEGVCHITTPEQFADFLRNTGDSSKSGISNVVLDNDIYMNEDFENALNWSSTSNERKLTKSSRGNFTQNSLTFNGNGYTIYGLSISLGTANWNTIFYINQNGITFSFNNTRFYGFYLQTNNSMGTFNPLAYSDTSPTIEFKEISFVKLNLKHLSSSVQAGRPKAFTGVQDDKYNIKTYFDFSFDECDFSGCEYIIARDWLSTNYYTPTKNNTTKVSIKNSKMPTKRVLDEGMYLLNVGANAYNNKTQEGTPESGHTNTNTIMNDTLESYVSTHNDFSDYDFDTNGDYEDLQPLEPYNPSKYEKVEITKIPEGSDFLWRAMDYDTSSKVIPNMVEGSSFGTYNANGTPTKNGSGKDCYISGNYNNYLRYDNLSSTQMSNFYANSNSDSYYTYIFKVYNTSGVGGIVSFRSTANVYNYMIRSNGNNFQVHDTGGHDLASLIDGHICKVEINYDKAYWYDLTDGRSGSITITTARNMGTTMFSIQSEIGATREASLSKWYGLYGIPRKLTDEETQGVVKILNDEKVYKWYKIGDPKLLLINPKTLEGV